MEDPESANLGMTSGRVVPESSGQELSARGGQESSSSGGPQQQQTTSGSEENFHPLTHIPKSRSWASATIMSRQRDNSITKNS